MFTPPPSARPVGLLQFLFWAFVIILAVFGGASQSDVPAQIFIGAGTGVVLSLTLVLTAPFDRRYLEVALMLGAATLIVAVQLVPLPPGLWQALPGHAPFVQGDRFTGHSNLWRPLSLTPAATLSALLSLLPPLTMLALVSGGVSATGRAAPRAILLLAGIGSIVGFVQFIGGHFDNPLIEEAPGLASGFMANRNHQAVLLALGIAAAPGSFLTTRRHSLVLTAMAAGTCLWFTCLILATGSRAGIGLSVLAWIGAIALAWPMVKPALRRLPRTMIGALSVGSVLLIAGVVAISIWAGRALSIERLRTLEVGEDMRSRGLPVVWQILRQYFPFGTGAGSFDPIFRVHEPFALLAPTFFNHAHNDWMEVVVTTGLPGALLLFVGVAWWLLMAWSAWRDAGAVNRRTGCLIILLLMLASIVDYPLRTPVLMGAIVLAACMAVRPSRRRGDNTLRDEVPSL